MNCNSCKFFKPASGFDKGYHGEHSGTCSSDKFVYMDGGKVPEDGLAYWDYEGYSAGFQVGAFFGCIHWEAA